MEFQKYTGLGNDFIITNENISSEKVSKLCDRRFGVGADGLIVAEKRNGKFFMKFFNKILVYQLHSRDCCKSSSFRKVCSFLKFLLLLLFRCYNTG